MRSPRRYAPATFVLVGVATAALSFVWGAACPDGDVDGYADCAVTGCDPSGLVCGDCDDALWSVHPGALETCDHRDDDCDGAVDEGFEHLISRHAVTDRHPHANDRFGVAVASIGDVNGDAVSDLAVGSPDDDLGTVDGGSVTLVSGADRAVLFRAVGAPYDGLGESVAGLGDMNGDGVPDLAASEPGHDAVVILSGADGSQIARCVDTASNVANFGGDHGLSGFADVTGDGIPEILVGADSSGTVAHQAGRAVVLTVSSGSCAILRVLVDPDPEIYDYFGYAVSPVADVTGDGVPEIAVGEPGHGSYDGSVLIYSGSNGAFVRRLTDPGGAANDHMGESLATIECLDGDGIAELVVGSPRKGTSTEPSGHVLVFSPEDGIVRRDLVLPTGGQDWLGWSIAVLPDVDGDGVDDIVAGARYADTARGADAGRAVVFSGVDGSVIADLVDPQGAAGDQLGYAVVSASDPSGDGVPEILVGAPYDDGAVGGNEGSASIFAREADCDGDGLGPFGGDCDDTNASLWSRPGEPSGLVFASDRRTMTWSGPADPGGSDVTLLYDALRSSAPGAFSTGICIASDQADLVAEDPDSPSAGALFFYLARAQNECGEGSLGKDSAGDPRPDRACP
jgi:hypothetical protein